MRKVKFLAAPRNYDLYLDEIIEYADENICVSIEDLGLKIESVIVECDNSYEAVKIATKKMFDKCKGYNFVEVGVTW